MLNTKLIQKARWFFVSGILRWFGCIGKSCRDELNHLPSLWVVSDTKWWAEERSNFQVQRSQIYSLVRFHLRAICPKLAEGQRLELWRPFLVGGFQDHCHTNLTNLPYFGAPVRIWTAISWLQVSRNTIIRQERLCGRLGRNRTCITSLIWWLLYGGISSTLRPILATSP